LRPARFATTSSPKSNAFGPDAATYSYLAACVLIWSSNWPLVKIALRDCPPFTFLSLRTVGAVIVLGFVALVSRQKVVLPVPGERRDLAIAGLLSLFAALACSTAGLKLTHVGRAMLLMYTMQLWAVPLGVWLIGERASAMRFAGSAIGLAGVIVFFNPGSVDWHDARAVTGGALLLLSAICWAWGACLYRRRVWVSGHLQQLFWQLIVCVPPSLALAMLDAEQFRSTSTVWGVLAYNWTAATVVGYWAWNRALTRVPATVAGQVVLLTPLLGFAWSAWFLGERWSASTYFAALLIIGGMIVTLRDAHASMLDVR